MARWSYDLTGADAIERNVPVYDATDLDYGEFLVRAAHGGTTNSYFITAYTGDATEMDDALGICTEARGGTGDATTTAPSTVASGGFNYLKAIINPFAVYKVQYATSASYDVAVTTGAATTTLTITSLENNIDGGWVFFPLASGGAQGKLRFLTESADGSATMDIATTTTTSDTIVKILPVGHRATALWSANGPSMFTSAAAAGSGTELHIVENFVECDTYGFQPLRYADHKSSDVGADARFYSEVAMLWHVYNYH